MSAHTPGPWKVVRYSNYAGWAVSAPNGPGCIAERWYKDEQHVEASYQDGEMEANARLIAAAPDLLVALRDIVDRVTAWESAVASVIGRHPDHGMDLSAARAAIAKATEGDG